MPVTVAFDLRREFEVKARAAEVFAVLADVPTSASHFPKVEQLVPLGDNRYRWELQKVGTAQIHIQTIYGASYVSDAKSGTVAWTPIPGVGNALVGGRWQIEPRKNSTHVALQLRGQITVPLPALMKPLVAPVVTRENEQLVQTYIDNLIRRFGGRA
jgi:carbon monoxide dehydrogenase subunit G